MSRHESKGCNPLLRALPSFINQPEAGHPVLVFQLFLHIQRDGVSSSPMGTMFASTPSKLSQSTKRTSHPSRLSPEVVVHVGHSQSRLCCGVACIIMLPCPCGQNERSISTGRFPVDESTVRLFIVVFEVSCHHGQGNALPPIPANLASCVVHRRVAPFLDHTRWVIAVVRCLLPRSSSTAPR